MELLLNLVWVVLAVYLAGLWLKDGPRAGTDRRRQFVALAMAILILLPAISMTDDLLAAQKTAEVDTCLRRDHDGSGPHLISFPPLFLPPVFSELTFAAASTAVPLPRAVPLAQNLALDAIQNRPPPVA